MPSMAGCKRRPFPVELRYVCKTPSAIAWCRAHTDPWRCLCAVQNERRRTAEADEIVLIHHVFNKAPASLRNQAARRE